MSLTTILNEIWRFIKDNFIKILVGALFISILAILGGRFLPNIMDQLINKEEKIEESNTSTLTEDAVESRKYLTNIYEQKPAEFQIYIQLEDGNVFANSFIFDEYFTSSAVVDQIENTNGIEYSQTLDHERNLELYKTSAYRGSIAGIRDSSSNVITIRVQAAESSQDNLVLAEIFEDMILNNEIPFIKDLNVTRISEATIGEKLVEDNLNMVSSPAALGSYVPVSAQSNFSILYGVAGFIIGILVSSVLLFIIQLFKNKITYAFQYSWDFDDYHIIYKGEQQRDKLAAFLMNPNVQSQAILSQKSPFIDQLVSSYHLKELMTSLTEVTNKNQKLESVILLVESKVTDKDWYNEQYRLAEMYGSIITIVHVIN